jgi:hypothetical protein
MWRVVEQPRFELWRPGDGRVTTKPPVPLQGSFELGCRSLFAGRPGSPPLEPLLSFLNNPDIDR